MSAWLPTLLYMAVIFYLSSLSRPPVPPGVPDPALHVPEYFVLGLLAQRSLARSAPRLARGASAMLAIAMSLAYGVSDEVHQSFVPGRVASAWDVAADGAGALLAVLACHARRRWRAARVPRAMSRGPS